MAMSVSKVGRKDTLRINKLKLVGLTRWKRLLSSFETSSRLIPIRQTLNHWHSRPTLPYDSHLPSNQVPTSLTIRYATVRKPGLSKKHDGRKSSSTLSLVACMVPSCKPLRRTPKCPLPIGD